MGLHRWKEVAGSGIPHETVLSVFQYEARRTGCRPDFGPGDPVPARLVFLETHPSVRSTMFFSQWGFRHLPKQYKFTILTKTNTTAFMG
ncbi:uncharacterized protein METZ01_LOCUS185940 [marine metagenome]|uniref:Uncharacterized protein n=1 Tax=marine metagenome TaxID=408172 RepID=A0A382D3K0_9ZZZZ